MIDTKADIPTEGAPGSLDAYINRTLLLDAESMPHFTTVPNGSLTAKLAITTASRGLLRSLGMKLAMYVGGAALVGGLIYIMPRSNEPSTVKRTITQPSAQKPALPAVSNEKAPIQSKAEQSVANTEKAHHALTNQKPPMKLDEGDDSKRPVIKDPNYKLP